MEDQELRIRKDIVDGFEDKMRKNDELWQKRLDLKQGSLTRKV